MIRLYNSSETVFTHNKTILKDALNCKVREELNGEFALELEYPLYQEIERGDVITAPTPKGEEPFRVYRVLKNLDTQTIYARHIFYDLIKNFLTDVRPTNLSCDGALKYILSYTETPTSFTGTSDVVGNNTAYYVRMNPIQAIIGAENSVLNNYGGYLVRSGKNIHIMKEPKDIGYEIRLGKNLLGVELDEDESGVITRIYPTAVLQDNNIAILPEKFVDSPYITNYAEPVIGELKVELTEGEKTLSTPMIQEIMRAKAQAEFLKNIDVPSINYKVDFIQLEKFIRIPNNSNTGLAKFTHDELANSTHTELSLNIHGIAFGDPTDVLAKMNQLDISHMVNIYVSKLGIYVKASIIKYSYDSIRKKFESIELGDYRPMARYLNQNIVLNMNRNLALKANQTSIETPTHVLTPNGFELKDEAGGLLMNKYGSVNNDNFSSRDNVEEGFPLWIPFEVDTDVSSIKKVSLWWKNFPYRATAKSALGGGGGVKTTVSGGGSTSGASSRSTTAERWDTDFQYFPTSNDDGLGVHNHTIASWLFAHSHDMAHTHPTLAHSHTLELEDHIHDLVFGIVETPIVDDTFTIWIDGTERMTVNARTGKQDITEWVQTVGDHEIELRSPTKKLIHANVSLKTYIRG
jgi:phage minor structural protein